MFSNKDDKNKENSIQMPLIDNKSNTSSPVKHFRFSKFKELQNICNKNCVVNCNKTSYMDFVKLDNEEIPKNSSDSFSAKSIIIFSVTLILSCLQIILYRKILNTFNTNNSLMTEFKIFAWRHQAICIFLVLYILIANYFIKNNYIEERRTINKDLSNIHMININIDEIVTKENLKYSFVNILGAFMFLSSTRYIPISIALVFNYSGVIIFYIFNSKKNDSIKMFCLIFFIFGVLLIISYNYEYNITHNLIQEKEGEKDTTTEKNNNNYDYKFFIGILISFLSSIMNYFQQKSKVLETMKNNPPMNTILLTHINAFIISSIILFTLELFYGDADIFQIFHWISTTEGLFKIGICLGLVGLLNMLFTIFSSIYLKYYFLKLFKIIEIPMADFIAIFYFNLYQKPQDFTYYISIFNFMISIALVEFYDIFNKNK